MNIIILYPMNIIICESKHTHFSSTVYLSVVFCSILCPVRKTNVMFPKDPQGRTKKQRRSLLPDPTIIKYKSTHTNRSEEAAKVNPVD